MQKAEETTQDTELRSGDANELEELSSLAAIEDKVMLLQRKCEGMESQIKRLSHDLQQTNAKLSDSALSLQSAEIEFHSKKCKLQEQTLSYNREKELLKAQINVVNREFKAQLEKQDAKIIAQNQVLKLIKFHLEQNPSKVGYVVEDFELKQPTQEKKICENLHQKVRKRKRSFGDNGSNGNATKSQIRRTRFHTRVLGPQKRAEDSTSTKKTLSPEYSATESQNHPSVPSGFDLGSATMQIEKEIGSKKHHRVESAEAGEVEIMQKATQDTGLVAITDKEMECQVKPLSHDLQQIYATLSHLDLSRQSLKAEINDLKVLNSKLTALLEEKDDEIIGLKHALGFILQNASKVGYVVEDSTSSKKTLSGLDLEPDTIIINLEEDSGTDCESDPYAEFENSPFKQLNDYDICRQRTQSPKKDEKALTINSQDGREIITYTTKSVHRC